MRANRPGLSRHAAGMSLALLLFVLLGAAPAPLIPLCRVTVTASNLPWPPLRSLTIALRPDCLNGHAFVRLASSFGPTDPPNGWRERTTLNPRTRYDGVIGNWHPEWQAASGITYRIPERP